MTDERKQQQTYLGDGVYASYDGYQIWLAVNHEDNIVVAIDPRVMYMLVQFARRIWDADPEGEQT